MVKRTDRLTIKDVAQLAGVSFQTVSLVINHPEKVAEKTLRRVQEVIQSVNFVPSMAARSMRQIRTKTLGCIFFCERASYDDRTFQIQDTYWNSVVQMLSRVADSKGYTLLQRHQSGDDASMLAEIREMFNSGRIDAMIAIVENTSHPVLLQLQKDGIPFIVFGTHDPSFPNVTQSNYEVTKKIVNHLHAGGCKRIAFISGARNGKTNQDVNERISGYRDAMQKIGLKVESKWMLSGDWSFASGHSIAQQLCSKKLRPDALIFASDRMALGALKGLHDLGIKIPSEVSVVGYDNMQYDDYCIPPLTSVHSPIYGMALSAIDILLRKIGELPQLDTDQIVFAAEIVVRESTRPIL
ncbi:alanine racemase [Undibacterium sp. KW1]|uniref:LacI family DNA-binding transcriptional regulator n=1 Tax=Undibacterium sp. KW1 TaxID=2058624 RepID=UPI001331D3D8|nr:LacI family DNA-binding transcriptional regulator [Undibacterium sp. KW1]BBB58429.1 alanine racemase [Undibacterium sp. KW1]